VIELEPSSLVALYSIRYRVASCFVQIDAA